METHMWVVIKSSKTPRCPLCRHGGELPDQNSFTAVDNILLCASVWPDVVFFGEPPLRRFFELNLEDFWQCDLLVVMGTPPMLLVVELCGMTILVLDSGTLLKVYPFAGLVNEVSSTTPRLLLNKESAGVWTLLSNSEEEQTNNYRDVQVLGSCNAGIWELTHELGWEEELTHLMRPHVSSS